MTPRRPAPGAITSEGPRRTDQEMRPPKAAIGTVAFAASVPATVVGVIPRLFARREDRPTGRPGQHVAGVALMVGGLLLLADGFVRFVRARGTPAPIAETERLVTSGPYRVTRNPQYVGVVATVAGEALWWGSRRVLLYAAGLAVTFDTWVRIYEEPRLRQRFPGAYQRYARRVPRWIGPLGGSTGSSREQTR
jgi:protein-S-isoprenylcysteine O-methyltransferase Ste14